MQPTKEEQNDVTNGKYSRVSGEYLQNPGVEQRSSVSATAGDIVRPSDEPRDKGYIQTQLDAILDGLKYKEIAQYVQLMNAPRKLIFTNLVSGIARGVGVALGISVFLVTALYALRALGALNLPIVGDYIADIVKVVQAQLEGRTY